MTAAVLLLVLQCNPSWAAEKTLLEYLLSHCCKLLSSWTPVSRHKRLGGLGSKPQSLEGIYYLCLQALNHPPCSQQANTCLVHSSTDDGAVPALLALETLTNSSSSWSLAFLTFSLYIHGFLALLCHLSSHPSPVYLPSIRAQSALPAPPSQTWDTDTTGMQQESQGWSPFAKQLSEVSKIKAIFHWRKIFFNLFLAMQK